jgi:tetratricopeptide (TPR) repeat protein
MDRTGSSYPMLLYALAHFDPKFDVDRAAAAPPDYCFPARIEEMLILESALAKNPRDAKAHYYFGNLLYDKHRRDEAIEHWEHSCRLDPAFSIPWRNLGIAYFNIRGDADRALECYARACQANPDDARLLYELDQLRKRAGTAAEDRLARLEQHRDLVAQRDDLTTELVTLYNQTGQSARALDFLETRRFHPWEGGEGLVSGQYVMAHFLLGRECLGKNEPAEALLHFEAARHYPHNLGEGKHLLTRETHLDYYTGLALAELGHCDDALAIWRLAANNGGDGVFAYYRNCALDKLGRQSEAVAGLRALAAAAERQMETDAKIDYFATSLPNFLLFEDDLQKRNRVECLFVRGLANLGLHRIAEATADLNEVIRLDRNHLWAKTELGEIEMRTEEASVP